MNKTVWMLIVVLLVFAAHNIWKLRNGVELGGDTSRYTESAQNIIDGKKITGKWRGYIGYSSVIALVKTLTPGNYNYLKILIGLQIVVATIALFCLFKVGQILFSTTIGIITVAISSINYIVVRWNHWVLTESLFASLLIISVYLCIRTAEKSFYAIFALPVIALTTVIRPNGMLLLLVFLAYLFIQLRTHLNKYYLVLISVVSSVVVVFAVQELQQRANEEVGIGMNGTIVMDKVNHYRRIKRPNIEGNTNNVLVENFIYIREHPVYSVRLMSNRLYAFFSLTREDYSGFHNKTLYFIMPIFYVIVVIGIVLSVRKGRRYDHFLILGLIAGQSAIVAFSLADHDHRYFSYIVNLITLYFSYGFVYLICRVKANIAHN